jgi:transposase
MSWSRQPRSRAVAGARAGCERALRAAHGLRASAAADRFTLIYLDECGFSPSQPVTASWVRAGQRKRLPYENPERRRVNVLAAYSPLGSAATLTWTPKRGPIVADDLLAFLERLPRLPDKPVVVVLDNASTHRGRVVTAARAALKQQHLHLYFLPPYSPKLNPIEAVFGGIKAHELPERAYASWEGLATAIESGFTAARQRLAAKVHTQPQLAA